MQKKRVKENNQKAPSFTQWLPQKADPVEKHEVFICTIHRQWWFFVVKAVLQLPKHTLLAVLYLI